MKRILSLVLVLALLACGVALAEGQLWKGGTPIDETPRSLDLNGDSSMETIYTETVPDDFESFQRVHVLDADGTESVYDAEIISDASAWAGDLNRDGTMEIFLWGDIMSDDYFTWCLHYNGDHLTPVLFADINRGENGQGYFKSGYGMLDDVNLDEYMITLSGSQDILGTYFMDRTLSLTEDGLFELTDDGMWVRDVSDYDDETWEYAALTAQVPIPCEIDGEAEVLNPGDRIMITGFDKASVVTFATADGREGRLAVSEDYARGWGSLVDGLPEEEAFGFLPYAD